MSFNNPRVVNFVPPTRPELNPVLDQVILHLEEHTHKYFRGKGLLFQLYSAWLLFFKDLRKDSSQQGTNKALDAVKLAFLQVFAILQDPPLNNPTAEDLVAIGKRLQSLLTQLQIETRNSKNAQDKAFALETALQQRLLELGKAKQRTSEAEGAAEKLRIQVAEVAKKTQSSEAINAVLAEGHKELEYLERLALTVHGMKSTLATAITQLADSTDVKKAIAGEESGFQAVDLTADIERRTQWLSEVRPLINHLAEQRRELEEKLSTVSDRVKFGTEDEFEEKRLETSFEKLNFQIDRLVEDEKLVTDQLRKLQSYQRAVELIRTFNPKVLMQGLLPEIQEIEPIEELVPIPVLPAGEVAKRFGQLQAISKESGLEVSAVFTLSLYECLPPALRQKAATSVLRAAYDAGLIRNFGLPDKRVLLESWRTPDKREEKFVQYLGKFAGGIYRRTASTLPWNVKQLFTPEEIETFVRCIPKNEK
ncbi:MAG: hypothetical protein KW788_01415 [Candidatus Doudnabacteria bacterium]|nr:hypothetical protein [Candidatus Doudnabacteria bacterium]